MAKTRGDQLKAWMDRNQWWAAPTCAVVALGGAGALIYASSKETQAERESVPVAVDLLGRLTVLAIGVTAIGATAVYLGQPADEG